MPSTGSAMSLEKPLGHGHVFGPVDVDGFARAESLQMLALLEQQREELAQSTELAASGLGDVGVHLGEEEVRSARHPAAVGSARSERNDLGLRTQQHPERLLVVHEARDGEGSTPAGGA